MGTIKVRRRVSALLVLLVTAVVVAGCGDDEEANEGANAGGDGAQQVEQPLLLSSSFGLFFLPIQVAVDQGYYEDEGLDVEVQETDGSSFVTQQVIAGNSDFGVAGAPSDIIAYEKDPSLRSFGCIETQSIFSIYVPADSPIQDVDDLDGQSIGITERGGGEEPLVTAVISENDLDTEIVPVGQETAALVRALETGEVAAFSSSIGTRTSIEQEVEVRTITPERFQATPGDCLIAPADVLSSETEVAAGLLRATVKGMFFSFANPEAALAIGCRIAPEQCEGQRGYAESLLEKMLRLMQPADPDAIPGQIHPPGWELTAELLLGAGVLDEPVDVSGLVASPEVQQVEAAAFENVDTVREEAEQDAAEFQG